MSPLRAAKSYVNRIRAAMGGVGENANELAALHVAQVVTAIHERECAGKATSLRQLHKITDLSQSEALKAVDDLEQLGWIEIDRNITDAFESRVSLSKKAGRQLGRVKTNPQTGKAA